MGKIFDLEAHRRASQSVVSNFRAAKAAKASSVMSDLPRSTANATTRSQCTAGMPRERHPEMVERASLSPSAAAAVPPNPSMTSFQLSTMNQGIVRTVRTCQGFASSETTFPPKYGPMELMQDPNDVIAARLKALRKELGERIGIPGGYSQTQFADEIGQTKSTYNPFETGKRALTFEVACAIRRRFQVPVDWLFFGDMPKIDDRTLFKLGPEPKAPVRVKRTASQK